MTVSAGRVVARLWLAAAMLASVPVASQAQVEGAQAAPAGSPAVFGGARRLQPGTDNVSVSGNILAGYDTNILSGRGSGTTTGSTDQTDSTFGGTSAQLQWSRGGRRVSYSGNVGGQYRTFFDIPDFDITSYNGSLGMQAELTSRSRISLRGTGSVQPFYTFGVLGGLPVEDDSGIGEAAGTVFVPDFQAARAQVVRYAVSSSYHYALGRRTSFAATASRTGVAPLNSDGDEAGLVNLGGTSVAARLTRRFTTNLSGRLGYGYTQYDRVRRGASAESAESDTVGVHDIDVGLNYSRGLTVARRTFFSFGTGSNITQRSDTADGGDEQGVRFNVSGFATLQREFLRTWSAGVNYRRGTSYVEGLNSLSVFDAATASVGGLFTDRLDGSASVGVTSGSLRGSGRDRFTTMSVGGQLRYGLTQNAAAFVSYTYARVQLPESRVPDVPQFRPERQGVRVGLSVWFDLLR